MAELQYPDIVGSYVRGMTTARQVQADKQSEYQQRLFQQLAPQAFAGDANATAQLAGIDPQTALALQRQQQAQSEAHNQARHSWLASGYQLAKQNPTLIPSLIAQGKQKGYVPADFPDQLTPEELDQAIGIGEGIAPQSQDQGYTLSPGQQRFVNDQLVASVPPSSEITPYQREQLRIQEENLRLQKQRDENQRNQPPKLSETDKKNRVLFQSVLDAEQQISGLTKNKGATDTSSITNAALVGPAKIFQSGDYRKYEAAGLRWAANLLYLKSGATANPDEIRSTWKQFFPQPGDNDAVKAQKAEARKQEIASVGASMASDIRIPSDLAPQATTASADNSVPADIAALLKKHGTK